MTDERKKEIALTIMNQIGKRAMFMIGGKQFLAMEKGLQFKIGRNAKTINKIQVEVSGMDLYDIRFYKGTKLVSKENDIYSDKLNKIIEKNTGMYTSL